jgi:hypothetical protein
MQALPFLPDTIPTWAIGLGIAVGGLYLLVLLAMPFSVFGLKSRLDDIEARLDDIQADIRALARPAGRSFAEFEDNAARPPVRAPDRAPRPVRREPRLTPPP